MPLAGMSARAPVVTFTTGRSSSKLMNSATSPAAMEALIRNVTFRSVSGMPSALSFLFSKLTRIDGFAFVPMTKSRSRFGAPLTP